MTHFDSQTNRPLGISRFTFGTTRLADESIPFPDRVKMARAAMDTGVWFHTSHDYGNAFGVLRAAFDEDRASVPKMIFKISGNTEQEMLAVIEKSKESLGVGCIDIMQVCLGDPAGNESRTGGPICETMLRLKREGTVGGYLAEVWPWTSDTHLAAVRSMATPGLIDAYIFYFNPMQRFMTNELFDLILVLKAPIFALRTLGGGTPTRDGVGQADVPVPWSRRVSEIVPVFERSGIASWTEFCLRFVFGTPNVMTTIGATSKVASLHDTIKHAQSTPALPADIQQEIEGYQRQWADLDRNATPWSM